LLLFFLSVFA
jgi:acetyl-CoA acyltransferase 1